MSTIIVIIRSCYFYPANQPNVSRKPLYTSAYLKRSSLRLGFKNVSQSELSGLSNMTEDETKGCWDKLFRKLCDVPEGCCCIFSLRTGALVFGWIFTVYCNVASFIWAGIAVASWDVVEGWGRIDDVDEQLTIFYKCSPLVSTVFNFVGGGISIVLLVAIWKGGLEYVKIWVQTFFILFMFGVLWDITAFAVEASLRNDDYLRAILVLAFSLTIEGLRFWGIIEVKSYYVQQLEALKNIRKQRNIDQGSEQPASL